MELKATRPGAILPVAAGQIVPDDHHGDAARQADENQPHHVLLVPGQESDGQQEHQDRTDDPVLHQGQGQYLDVAEHEAQFFIFHLGQGRVHHQDQANGDGDVGGAHGKEVDEILDLRKQITAANAHKHGQKNPQGEKAVQKT